MPQKALTMHNDLEVLSVGGHDLLETVEDVVSRIYRDEDDDNRIRFSLTITKFVVDAPQFISQVGNSLMVRMVTPTFRWEGDGIVDDVEYVIADPMREIVVIVFDEMPQVTTTLV